MAKKSNPLGVVRLVLGIAFGVVVLAALYAAFRQGGEIRSKASQSYATIQAWEFDKDKGGWSLDGFTSTSLRDGIYGGYRATALSTVPSLFTRSVESEKTAGVKQLRLLLMAKKGEVTLAGIAAGVGKIDDKVPPALSFTTEVYVRKVGESVLTQAGLLQITADGTYREYTLTLPNSLNLSRIDQIHFLFRGLRNLGDVGVGVDWIRLVTPIDTPTPTGTPVKGQPVTKTGTVSAFQLEGVRGHILKASDGTYRLLSGKTNLDPYVGKNATVTGTLTPKGQKSQEVSIPMPQYATIVVSTITAEGVSAPAERPSWCVLSSRFPGLLRLSDYQEKCR